MSQTNGTTQSIEVAAMLGDSVVGVKHCIDPRGGKVTTKTWAFFAGGVAMLLLSATAFAMSVSTAATNKARLHHHTHDLKKPAYSFRPTTHGPGLDALAFGGLALGLAGCATALLRARREKASPYYRIGTAPGVEQPNEQAPSESFPLVAPLGDAFVFNYGPGIEGELNANGTTVPLAALAAAGHARPSATVPGAFAITIPADARIRARAGQTTFIVTSTPRPVQHATPLLASLDSRVAKYVAGSFAAHIGMLAILQAMPAEASGAAVDVSALESATTRAAMTERDTAPEEPVLDPGGETGGDQTEAAAMKLDQGRAGRPDEQNPNGALAIKNNGEPRLSREEAVAQARESGWLGDTSFVENSIQVITGDADLSSGLAMATWYGAEFGAGNGRGNFGMGRDGRGLGGGCGFAECGTVGTGGYITGRGPGNGDGYSLSSGAGRETGRKPAVPTVKICGPGASCKVIGGLDKAIIRRYVKQNIDKITYCYERELYAKPTLSGTVMVNFLISPTGAVTVANGSGLDATVASCVADKIKSIEFPKPPDGTPVEVNYPFTFRAAGR